MSKFTGTKIYRKSQTQDDINSTKKIEKIIESKKENKEKENKESKPQEKTETKITKSSFFGGGRGGSGFFDKSSAIDIKKEPLGSYYEERKKIIFGEKIVNKDEYYLSQFLLNSQQKINDEYIKMSSSYFFAVQKVYNFTLTLKENIANFCLIIKIYLLNDKKDKANEIFLLMCKQNKRLFEFIYDKLSSYCKKASPTMLRFSPTIAKMFIQILSCLIKLSIIFNKTTFQNIYIVYYLKTIYALILREISKVNTFRSDLKSHRLYIYSNCIFDISNFIFFRYQPLCFSTYSLQHLLDLYEEQNLKEKTKYEQILLLKINYNLGLFLYVDGKNNEAINYLLQAKKILSEMVLYSFKNDEKEYITDIWRNSAILENQEKHLISKLKYFKERKDERRIELTNKYIKKNVNLNKTLTSIKEENNKNSPKTQTKKKNISRLYLGLKRLETNQPILYEHIKRKIFFEIELLLCQIELNKKNYRTALEHINIILNRETIKDDFDIENSPSKKKPFNTKTFKNLKSFQGLRIKKLSDVSINQNKVEDKNKNIENINLESNSYEESILTENDIESVRLLLEKIEHDYTQSLHLQQRKSFITNKRSSYYPFYKTNSMNYTNFKEMEKFFIFICSLSIFQLKILNESQPKSFSKRNDLPIIFSNQFQDCLTNAQRLELSNLETMTLSRYVILIDTDKDISPENLDYKYMKHKIKTIYNNNEEDIIKVISDDKGKTINSRKSIDSGMNTISTNNNNPLSIKRNIKKEIEFEDESCIFDILLNKIKDENNKNFIEAHKKCILKILKNLSSEDKKLFEKSPDLLKKMLDKIEIQIKKKNNTIETNKNNINYSTDLKESNYSFLSSQS